MALRRIEKKYIPTNNDFYRNHYQHVLIFIMGILVIVLILLGVIFYQILNRPLPPFNAVQPDGKKLILIPSHEPNLMPATILRWARKAATIAYTFDFLNFNDQLKFVRPYFTETGWNAYISSVTPLITSVVRRKLFVNGVVSGTPIISNQGELPGKGYVWRVQIPFLVTYQGANVRALEKRHYHVIMTIVRVPTSVNKQAVGIDQFLMV